MIETNQEPDRFTEVRPAPVGHEEQLIHHELSQPHPDRPDHIAAAGRVVGPGAIEIVYVRVDLDTLRL